MTATISPIRPRLVTPAATAAAEYVAITPEMRAAYEDTKALVHRLARTFDAPFNTMTTVSGQAAEYQATCLAAEARALANAIRKAGR